MNVKQLIDAISKYPDDWEVMIDCDRILEVQPLEGTTSDGPGTINIVGADE